MRESAWCHDKRSSSLGGRASGRLEGRAIADARAKRPCFETRLTGAPQHEGACLMPRKMLLILRRPRQRPSRRTHDRMCNRGGGYCSVNGVGIKADELAVAQLA